MTETYKKEIIKEALVDLISSSREYAYQFNFRLIKLKTKELEAELREAKKQYDEVDKAIIDRNAGRDPKDYDVSNAVVKRINKNIKNIERLDKNISFYTKVATKVHLREMDEKRIEKLVKFIYKL